MSDTDEGIICVLLVVAVFLFFWAPWLLLFYIVIGLLPVLGGLLDRDWRH